MSSPGHLLVVARVCMAHCLHVSLLPLWRTHPCPLFLSVSCSLSPCAWLSLSHLFLSTLRQLSLVFLFLFGYLTNIEDRCGLSSPDGSATEMGLQCFVISTRIKSLTPLYDQNSAQLLSFSFAKKAIKLGIFNSKNSLNWSIWRGLCRVHISFFSPSLSLSLLLSLSIYIYIYISLSLSSPPSPV